MSGLLYIGGGFFHGVPARDLTEEEAKEFGREKLIRSGLYVENDLEAEPDEPKGKPKPAENKMAAGPQENK